MGGTHEIRTKVENPKFGIDSDYAYDKERNSDEQNWPPETHYEHRFLEWLNAPLSTREAVAVCQLHSDDFQKEGGDELLLTEKAGEW